MEAILILDLATYDGGFRVTVYGPNKGTPVDRTTGRHFCTPLDKPGYR